MLFKKYYEIKINDRKNQFLFVLINLTINSKMFYRYLWNEPSNGKTQRYRQIRWSLLRYNGHNGRHH